MKKIILLLLMLFCFTGCSVDYNLQISENEFYEYIVLTNGEIDITPYVLKTIKTDYGAYYLIDYDGDPEHCDLEECANENYQLVSSSLSASNSYNNIDSFKKSLAISSFFGDININEKSGIYNLKATPDFHLSYIFEDINYLNASVDEVKININNAYNVVSHNADSVNGNTYTWIYNKDNLSKEINMTYSKEEILNNDDSSINDLDNNNNNNNVNNLNKNNYIGYIFLAIAGIVIIIIGVKFIHKIRKNDAV